MRMGATVPGHVLRCFAVREARPMPATTSWMLVVGLFASTTQGQQSSAAEKPVYFLARPEVPRGQDPVFVDQFRPSGTGRPRFGEPMVRGATKW